MRLVQAYGNHRREPGERTSEPAATDDAPVLLTRVSHRNTALRARIVTSMRFRASRVGRLVRSIAAPLESKQPAEASLDVFAALDDGAFAAEITPIELKSRKGTESFAQDEHPRPQATLEALAKLPSVFAKGGVVSAGNASGICDGAAANVVVSEAALSR